MQPFFDIALLRYLASTPPNSPTFQNLVRLDFTSYFPTNTAVNEFELSVLSVLPLPFSVTAPGPLERLQKQREYIQPELSRFFLKYL